MKNQLNSKKFFSAMAFIALVISGVALLISKIFLGANTVAATVLNSIAYVLAFVVTSFCAYNYVKTKHSIVWVIVYIVAVVIVVVPLVLTMFGK